MALLYHCYNFLRLEIILDLIFVQYRGWWPLRRERCPSPMPEHWRAARWPARAPRRKLPGWRRHWPCPGRRCRSRCRARGVAIGIGMPPCTVTPREKPMSFIAICPWSWYMVTIASTSFAFRKMVSAGYMPTTGRPSARAFSTVGPITSSSSRPKLPFSPLCGLRPHTAMRGASTPARISVAWTRRMASRMRSSVIRLGDLLQRHMAGDAAGPQPVQRVDLADRPGGLEQDLGEPVGLVGMADAGQVQPVLVQRREAHAVGDAGDGELGGLAQRVERVAPAIGGGDRPLEGRLRGAAIVEQHRHAGGEGRTTLLGEAVVEAHPGDPHALLQLAAIGDQQDVGGSAILFAGQQAGDDLRADAGGIAEGEGDAGLHGLLLQTAHCGGNPPPRTVFGFAGGQAFAATLPAAVAPKKAASW